MDLQSIAPASRTVPLGSGTVAIAGLSLRKLTQLVIQFPELLALASGKIDLASLVVSAPEAVLAMFGMGITAPPAPRWFEFWNWFRPVPSEAAILKAFDEASTGQQIELLSQIFELTFEGQRARPFLAAVVTSLSAPESVSPAPSAEISPPPSSS